MANEEQLARLKASVAENNGCRAWNEWRQDSNALNALMDLRMSNLTDWDLWNEWPQGINVPADLSMANFSGANLARVNLTEANLVRVNLIEADLGGANLSRANLSGSDLVGTNLTGANLREANLNGADLSRANLSRADPLRADLSHVNLSRANLNNIEFLYTNFMKAQCSSTLFMDVHLGYARNLETVIHRGASYLSIDTVYRSRGEIPDIFLRGCGVPDDLIAYIRSIRGSIQYYTVFISYSSQNRDFTQRLYNDMQGSGIRCWFDQRSLKAGDSFWDEIDQAIILYDKVIVALSAESLQSVGVEREVHQALAKEEKLRQRGTSQTVLFPVRLDDAVMTTDVSWARNILHSRHIIDFRGWKSEDDYQVALAKLLDDLKTTV